MTQDNYSIRPAKCFVRAIRHGAGTQQIDQIPITPLNGEANFVLGFRSPSTNYGILPTTPYPALQQEPEAPYQMEYSLNVLRIKRTRDTPILSRSRPIQVVSSEFGRKDREYKDPEPTSTLEVHTTSSNPLVKFILASSYSRCILFTCYCVHFLRILYRQ